MARKVSAIEKAFNREERRYRPRVSRAFVTFANRLRNSIDEKELRKALTSGNIKKAMALFDDERMKRISEPMAAILRDATVKGARAGAKEIP